MEVYRLTRSWDENGATWIHAAANETWASQGGDYAGTGGLPYASNNVAAPDETLVTWDVAPLVQEWVSGTNPNYGLEILSYQGNQLTFDSSEIAVDGVGQVVPTLVVDYTIPEPAGLSLLGVGGLALARRRRR